MESNKSLIPSSFSFASIPHLGLPHLLYTKSVFEIPLGADRIVHLLGIV